MLNDGTTAEKDDAARGSYNRQAARGSDNRRQDRRRAILDAAEELFLEQGFGKVSLGVIVRHSGGSLATLYELFKNKQGLLHAVVERRREEWLKKNVLEVACNQRSPSEILRRFAYRCYEFVTAPRSIALLRIVISESLNDPEFGRDFYRDTNSETVDQLAGMLREWSEGGKADIDDPKAAAELFFAIVMCDTPLKAMLGAVPEENNCGQIEWRIASFLSHFKFT